MKKSNTLRNVLIFLAVFLLGAVGYAYYRDPAGCEKVLNDAGSISTSGFKKFRNDAGSVVTSLLSFSQHPHAALPTPAVPAPPAPPTAAAPAPAPVHVTAVPASPPPIKPWAPPDVMPSQPNWTWTTSDGKTYQDVVVTKIEPDTVSITHSLGVAHIPIAVLAPDIQKKLNYDPVAAAAARAETQREAAHPYYAFASRAEAQGVARQLHWPLAWLASTLDYSTVDPQLNPWADLTQMALSDLKSQAIIIFIDNNNELGDLPSLIRDQLFILDDGPIPGGHHFYGPKIVISNPDATKIFGRISFTQMKASRALAIDEVLASIPKDSGAQPPLNGSTASAPASPSSAPAVVPNPSAAPAAPATSVAASTSVPVANPSPDATKPWVPPDVMPAQPNWTWTALDGKTYQDVVVTKIEPDTVTITHSLGVAHIPINLLPPDIQKQLNYDPHEASPSPASSTGH
jgi:hypothetical protein